MKILHIGQLIGGLDIYIRNSIMFSSNEFEFVIVHGVEDNSKPIIKNGKQIKEYKISLFRKLNPIKDLKGLWQVLKIIKIEKPDIIHCHSAKGGFIGRIAGFLTTTKTYYTPHAFSFLSTQDKLKKMFFLLLERIAKLNSNLLACSNSEKDLGIDIVHYKKNRVFVWNNSVPDAKDSYILTKIPSSPYICYIGRPCYQKNSLFLVNIVKKIQEKHPDILFYVLGVGYYSPDLEIMKQKIKESNLEQNIKLLPWLNHNETMGYLKNAMFYLTTSRYEGLPLAVIEAMSLGKCIVASNVIGNKDCVKDNYNGYLIDLDENEFTEKINRLIENPQLIEVFGINSRKYFEDKFKINKQIRLLEKIYKNEL